MRFLLPAVLTSLALLVTGCSDSDGGVVARDRGTGGAAGDDSTGDAGGDPSTGDAGAGPSRGGSVGTGQTAFTDLPGKIRFVNFVSDGTAGVDLDLYWGTSLAYSELVGTVAYGEITDFMTPRRDEDSILDADEARYFMVPEGDVSGTPSSFLVQDDPTFAADTVLTIGLAAADNAAGAPLSVSVQIFYEAELATPPAGMAHVFEWSKAFDSIADGDFVVVGADGLCAPDLGDSGGANLGAAALIPEGTTGLALFDANTQPPCDTGTMPVTETVEAGHSYVLLGQADTYEIGARRAVFLEVGAEN